MQQYLDLLKDVVSNGRAKGDRTNTGVISVFGRQLRFDLSTGEFPLLTTKKMFTKGVIEELLWFLRGSVNVKELQDVGVRFWDSWVDEEGTIGHGYGKQFRNMERFSIVKPKIYARPKIENISKPLPEPLYSSDMPSRAFRVGAILNSSKDGRYQILEHLHVAGRSCYRIGFINSGTVRVVDAGNANTGMVRDPYNRSVYFVGYYGEYSKDDPHLQLLKDTWRTMIARCYNPQCSQYASYGGRGVHVHEDWHCFATFQKEVKQIPGWSLKLEYPSVYSLDKDSLWGSNRYGKDTCCWASIHVQMANVINVAPFQADNEYGNTERFFSAGDMVEKYDLDYRSIFKCIRGERQSVGKWRNFKSLYDFVPEGHLLRYDHVDQVETLIAELKHNPCSRRHVISLWDAVDIRRTTLPPCHGSLIEFMVFDLTEVEREEITKLTGDEAPLQGISSMMVQRSGDVFLGIPVNIASYALFTLMVAQTCGYHPMEFVYQIGDCHAYSNHIEQIQLQLTRDPFPLPKMRLNRDVKDIFAFKHEDFTLEGYVAHPSIKAPVAV